MWSRRDATVALTALALAAAGCGFEPLYARRASGGSADAVALGSIRIAPIANRPGQMLHNLLLDRLTPQGTPAAPRYVLSVQLSESKREFALQSDETPTRATLTERAVFALSPIGEARIFRGSALSANSYNVLRSDFATLAAERDARYRGLQSLADDISLRVAAALRNPTMFRTTARRAR